MSFPADADVQAADTTSVAPTVIGTDPKNAIWYLPVRVSAGGRGRDALLRGVLLAGAGAPAPEALTQWHGERDVMTSLVRPIAGLPRALDGVGSVLPAVFPPLFYCTEKKVFVPAPDLAASDPRASLWEAARGNDAAGAASTEIPCLTCGERDKCYPASGPSRDPGTAGTRLVAIAERPWGGLLVEPFHVPFSAWVRLASGEPWRTVRASLASWPAPLLAELDRVLGGARATVLAPEHGASFALETLLLRLDWLRQTLLTLRGMAENLGRPHLGIGPETLAIAIGACGVWGGPLSNAKVVFLTNGAHHATGDGRFEPVPGRSTAMVPPQCRGGAAWVRGRCLPRGTAKTLTSAKTWEFNFLPSESTVHLPAKGSSVRFALDSEGEPTGPAVDGLVGVAFSNVWSVTVGDPKGAETTLREMLQHDDGRPAIVMQAISDHSLADDLYAVGSLWLSAFVAEPGSIPAAVRLREALRATPAQPAPPGFYAASDGAPAAKLPAELLDAAYDLGNRLCGGAAGSFPGQNHDPVAADKRLRVYDEFIAEASALASEARLRLFGHSPADAEIRSLLEGAFRAS